MGFDAEMYKNMSHSERLDYLRARENCFRAEREVSKGQQLKSKMISHGHINGIWHNILWNR